MDRGKTMVEENEKKYSKKFSKSIVVEFGRGAVAVRKSVSIRKTDNREFENITITGGFVGDLGFIRNKFNANLDLPIGLSKSDFANLFEAYQKVSGEKL